MNGNWTIVPFGKYKDKSLPQIILLDPDWFFYMLPKFYGRLADEAQNLARKATAIKIPGPDGHKKLVEYWREEGYPPGSSGFGFVDANSPCYNRWATRQHHLDLSIVHRAKPYDKRGGRRLIQCFRHRYFGANTRVTKERCEDFFSNEANFAKRRSHAKAA
jgi:hypothetical protein